jgi:hypothetical protein
MQDRIRVIQEEIAAVTGLSATELDTSLPFARLGIESLQAVNILVNLLLDYAYAILHRSGLGFEFGLNLFHEAIPEITPDLEPFAHILTGYFVLIGRDGLAK